MVDADGFGGGILYCHPLPNYGGSRVNHKMLGDSYDYGLEFDIKLNLSLSATDGMRLAQFPLPTGCAYVLTIDDELNFCGLIAYALIFVIRFFVAQQSRYKSSLYEADLFLDQGRA